MSSVTRSVLRLKYADASGRQVMETLGPAKTKQQPGGVTRRVAERELRDRLSKVDRGWRRPKPLTFADYSRCWLDEGERKLRWKINTVKAYETVVARLVEHFGPMQLGTIRPRHVADYVNERVKSFEPATVNRDVSILHFILKTAKRQELVESNAAEGAERPKVRQRKWRILKPVEVGLVARAFEDAQAKAVFLTLVLTGLRRSELLSLRWRDVDLVENVLHVVDSKSEDGVRSIAIPPMLAEELWQQRRRSLFNGDGELVFSHPERGTTYSADTFRDALDAALAAAKVDAHVRPFHDLRHTAITNDAASGASPIAVMTKAGHADMRTTKRYLHLAGVVFREEAERLEQRLLGGTSTGSSTDLSALERIERDPVARNRAGSAAVA